MYVIVVCVRDIPTIHAGRVLTCMKYVVASYIQRSTLAIFKLAYVARTI